MKARPSNAWDPQAAPSFWINHVSRLVMRQFEQHLRPLGFGMASMPVVFSLEEADGPLLQKDLAARVRVEQPTMAALLVRMEADGLIVRAPHPTDKRASQISLTPKAKSLLPKAKRVMTEIAERVTEGFSERESATLLSLLRRAASNLSAADG